ncbi:ParB/RepB/Spo0J family partition protein [Microlunatus sp. Gsoil 973]|uniref:ParB/RepB/Spo0J family partition protein n=1 Tax=Microlunatus sp. Gsoil 973 TaxID=2672569 RepID=UPI0012B4AEF4|nr:ParB/RepB/Spo0J family partition protein [Microlunatus sp. Gsoil 973]QGN34533.1 ParB/RepB/Spo0J family partition protein [Microlunatus sp. Gsoil 973]
MSNTAPRGLGRGLGQLLQRSEPAPTNESDVPTMQTATSPELPTVAARSEPRVPVPEGSYFAEVPVDSIRPNPKQPRQVFDEDELNELAESITEVGLLQPVVVRPLERTDDKQSYELVMGERRWRATQAARLEVIPAIVRRTEDADLLRDALLENLHRSQLNPLEEAAAYQQMLQDFDCSQEELSRRIKRSRPQISNTIRLLKLPPSVQRRVAAGVLSAGHARALLMIEDHPAQERMAQRVVAEGLSVRATEELAALGDPAEDRRPRLREKKEPSPRAAELAERLSDRLETRVKVDQGRSRGRITIEFATDEDLDRIAQLLTS